MRKISQTETLPTRLLLRFRSFVSRPEVQVLLPVVYQVYTLLCLVGFFKFRAQALPLLIFFVAADVLASVIILVPKIPVNGQLICAINMLLTAGLSGQSAFADRYPITAGGNVQDNTIKIAEFMLIGAVCGAACFGVCKLLSLLLENAKSGSANGSGKGIVLLCNLGLIAIAAFSLVMLSMDSLWVTTAGVGFQPSEVLKFLFLAFVAFVSGVESEHVSYRLKMIWQVVAFLFVALAYAGQSEFGSLLVVTLVFGLFLLISNKNWLATMIVVAVLAVLCAAVVGVVLGVGNTYINEKYGEQTYLTDEAGNVLTDEAGDPVPDTADNKLYGHEFPAPVQKLVNLFTYNYEKIYMRFMVTKDIDGTDPGTPPGVREALQSYYSDQAHAALDAIGISRLIPYNGPIFKYVAVGMSDYVYTSVLQAGGLVGVIFMLFAYILMADTAFSLVCRNCSLFHRYIVFVMVTVLQMQLFINVLGVNNVIPLTGITLPFVSAGGSSLVVCTMMLATVFFADMDYNARKRRLVQSWEDGEHAEKGVELYDLEQFSAQ